jgi:hypothetical protein
MADIADLAADRITYREGQRLMARDLQDDRDGRARLRRLHVRHLHETWGIATGFDVRAAGTSHVAVGPGYALDRFARDLVLSTSIVLPVPDVAGPQAYVLVATFIPDCAFPATAAGAAVCLNTDVHPRGERPAFAWRTSAELEPGAMVPLCHVVVENKAIKGAVQTRVRRYSRRLVRPYVASGRTDPDPDAWLASGFGAGYYRTFRRVDTSDAGFTGTPQYFAQLVPAKPSTRYTVVQVEVATAGADSHITEAAADGFVFEVFVREPFIAELKEKWAIAWVGAQPMAGCPPVLNLKRLFTLAGHVFAIK